MGDSCRAKFESAKEFKILLSELSERIGFGVRVTKSLPALDHLKDHFLAMVGDPGEISDW